MRSNRILQDRDWTTKNMFLADKYTFAANQWDYFTRTYLEKLYKLVSSTSWRRWLTCNMLFILKLIRSGALLSIGLRRTALTSRKLSCLWSLGFGAVTLESLVACYKSGNGGLLLNVLVAKSTPGATLHPFPHVQWPFYMHAHGRRIE